MNFLKLFTIKKKLKIILKLNFLLTFNSFKIYFKLIKYLYNYIL